MSLYRIEAKSQPAFIQQYDFNENYVPQSHHT